MKIPFLNKKHNPKRIPDDISLKYRYFTIETPDGVFPDDAFRKIFDKWISRNLSAYLGKGSMMVSYEIREAFRTCAESFIGDVTEEFLDEWIAFAFPHYVTRVLGYERCWCDYDIRGNLTIYIII